MATLILALRCHNLSCNHLVERNQLTSAPPKIYSSLAQSNRSNEIKDPLHFFTSERVFLFLLQDNRCNKIAILKFSKVTFVRSIQPIWTQVNYIFSWQ